MYLGYTAPRLVNKLGALLVDTHNVAEAFRTGRDELLQEPGCELSSLEDGGADGIRTHYLLTASQTLSRLSYSPM